MILVTYRKPTQMAACDPKQTLRGGLNPADSGISAQLIRQVYEADPLACPKCKGPMRVIALMEDPKPPQLAGRARTVGSNFLSVDAARKGAADS